MLLYQMSKRRGISCAEAKDTLPSITDHNRGNGKENKLKHEMLLLRAVKSE